MVPEQMRKKPSFDDYHDSNKFDKEFVKPIKFIPKFLHSHDILYGGDNGKYLKCIIDNFS